MEKEKSLTWNITSNSKGSSKLFDRPVKVSKLFFTATGSNGSKECLIDESNASWIAVSKTHLIKSDFNLLNINSNVI